MGNVLIYAAGKGINAFHDVARHPERYPLHRSPLDEHDASVFYGYRVANLRKLFPYIPLELNNVLVRFSKGSIDFYEDLQAQADDLRAIYG
jgi:hypothetical protein